MSTEPFIVNINLWDHEQAQQWMAQDFVTKMVLINDTLWEQMTWAQTMYEEFSNHRRDHGLIIKKGDMVWLDARNLVTEHFSKKLSNKFKESFCIICTIGTHTSKLEILKDWGHHDVFDNYLLLNMQVSVFAVGFQAIGFRAMASVYGYFGQPK